MIAVIMTVSEAAGPTVSEKKTETMFLRTPDKTSLAPPLVIEAAGQRKDRRPSYYIWAA